MFFLGILSLVGVFNAKNLPRKTGVWPGMLLVRLFELKTCREILVKLLDLCGFWVWWWFLRHKHLPWITGSCGWIHLVRLFELKTRRDILFVLLLCFAVCGILSFVGLFKAIKFAGKTDYFLARHKCLKRAVRNVVMFRTGRSQRYDGPKLAQGPLWAQPCALHGPWGSQACPGLIIFCSYENYEFRTPF